MATPCPTLQTDTGETKRERSNILESSSVSIENLSHQTPGPVTPTTAKPIRATIGTTGGLESVMERRVTLENRHGFPIVEDDIFWSRELENALPKGFSEVEADAWMDRTRKSRVTSIHRATWRTCGQGKNKHVRLADGTAACARYRHPFILQVQGELYSYYLGRLLGIDHVPPVVLAVVNGTAPLWSPVAPLLSHMQWEQGVLVALIRWIDYLKRGKMPVTLLEGEVSGQDRRLLAMGELQLLELMQWSDLIILDYITANSDRVASNQDAADLNNDPVQMRNYIHNLQKSQRVGAIWLIDNESGLIDGYMLLQDKRNGDRFTRFHRFMLERMCLFRRSTVKRVEELHSLGTGAAEFLLRTVAHHEPLTGLLPPVPSKIHLDRTLADRIAHVYNRIRHCMLANMSPMY
ncbi:four-jointed box protein 1-like [Branchiostoma floridae]|uniref:Four-jointed box protein 1-like n=1 Tax=Branchiostoma floridae TaxID=7739 RepID=A0A9J7M4F2_BRAFL|nr:four-jointed box protein 1-like [Branchiostoma floridae]